MSSSSTRSLSRLAICAWAEASRALIGSSAIRQDRPGHQRPGDGDPLPLAAAELVRIAVGRGGRKPDALQQLGGLPQAVGAAAAAEPGRRRR